MIGKKNDGRRRRRFPVKKRPFINLGFYKTVKDIVQRLHYLYIMDTSTTTMRKTKPTYLIMIAKALLALNESEKKVYHSRYKIAEFIRKIYPVSSSYKRYLRDNLKFGVTKKYFLQRKESFRLSALGKQGVLHTSLKKATKVTRPPRPTPSTTTSSTTTTTTMSQKAARKAARRVRRARSQVSRSQISKAKALVNSIPPSPSSKPHKWQYEERPAVFYDYDSKASTLVEGAYKEYVAAPSQWDVRSIHSGEWCYQVDFPNMIQTNIQHENHNVRVIRRVPC
uniref:Linker histone H1 and H5 family protein n=1 Tax=Pithovirus LCPAC304 TaxID=2506594 RepID=A0A481Z7N0_9VIRU|nr:MAG: linker histone H1 and H5 family protein [Pithovirus LCPAC304]